MAPPSAPGDCSVTNLGITPLPDLGLGSYKGFTGGLYPNGLNTRPPAHEAVGLRIANEEIVPRDAAGNVDTNNGKIVMISVGMSNTTDEFSRRGPTTFKPRADADPSKNPQLIIVDGAQGGRDSVQWTNVNSTTWSTLDARLTSQQFRVTTQQVQIAWIKQARGRPSDYGVFPAHARVLQDNLEMIVRALKVRYPNIKLVYLSSRTRAYVELATGGLNPETYAYESSFSVKWAIENQINGAPHLNWDASKGPVATPYMCWGPYLWADGLQPRSDGFTWLCSDLRSDFTHPSTNGATKVADQLLAFFKTDATTTPWFLRKTVVGQLPVCAPSASTTSGVAPLRVNFAANASDPDGMIREYWWTFEDGTFSTNANPVKVFPTAGTYHARLTVVDNDGNTGLGAVVVNAGATSLRSAVHTGDQFQFAVIGATNLDHIVQGSLDLRDWVSLWTNRGPFTFTHRVGTGFATRFYRVASIP